MKSGNRVIGNQWIGATGQSQVVLQLFSACLMLARELDDTAAIADGLYWIGATVVHLGDLQRHRQLNADSIVLWRQVGDPWGICWPLRAASEDAAMQGDYERATELQEQRLCLAQEAADPRLVANAYSHLGVLAYEQGQHDRAAELLESARRGSEESGGGGEAIPFVLHRIGGTGSRRRVGRAAPVR
jgi:hypothetical protein